MLVSNKKADGINNKFKGQLNGNNAVINGSFDINVWYSYDNDTKTEVITKRFSYNDKMNIPLKNDAYLDNNSEIIVRSLKQPTVRDAKIKDGIIILTIEKELGVEIVANTKVKISVEEFDDDYVELIDDETLKEVSDIKEDYLE